MLLLLLALLQTTPPPTPPPGPPGCTSAEYRQFDFWLGDWEVRGPKGQVVGYNRITSILGGCALREEWTSTNGAVRGVSHNMYDPSDKRWHQSWTDNSSSRLTLVGGLVGRNMVMEQRTPGDGGATDVQRITWTPLSEGRVRQLWESSKNGGATWTAAFDGTYSRRDRTLPAKEGEPRHPDEIAVLKVVRSRGDGAGWTGLAVDDVILTADLATVRGTFERQDAAGAGRRRFVEVLRREPDGAWTSVHVQDAATVR
ncbi:MAG: hypothetical protein AB7O28_13150 [Vicinamibacterales bacterium]